MPTLWRIDYAKYEVLGYFPQIFDCCVTYIKNYFKVKFPGDKKIGAIQMLLINFGE